MRKLEKKLQKQLAGCKRIAVLGVGLEQRADDAAGILLVRQLRSVISLQPFVALECKGFEWGDAPEQVTGLINAFQPTQILVVDAADIGVPVGECREIDAGELPDISFSTPLPLKLITDHLNQATGAEVTVVAIQPGSLDFGDQITPAVEYGVTRLMHALQTVLWECDLICQGNELAVTLSAQESLNARNRALTYADSRADGRRQGVDRGGVPMSAGAA